MPEKSKKSGNAANRVNGVNGVNVVNVGVMLNAFRHTRHCCARSEIPDGCSPGARGEMSRNEVQANDSPEREGISRERNSGQTSGRRSEAHFRKVRGANADVSHGRQSELQRICDSAERNNPVNCFVRGK